MLCEQIKPCAEIITGNYQCGFRTGRSTSDQIHALRRIFGKTAEFNISTCHLFIDFKSAYDSTERNKLLKKWKDLES
jgi:sorting nexin-29